MTTRRIRWFEGRSAGPFARHAHDADRLGITAVPTVTGKGPKRWTDLARGELLEMSGSVRYRQHGIAFRCDGHASLDVDTDDPRIKEAIWRVIFDHGLTMSELVGRRGSKGAAFLFRDPSGAIESFQLIREPHNIPNGEGEIFFEVLAGHKRMITWPPSLHRKTGLPYTEIGRSLWSIACAEEIPICMPALVRDLRSALAPWTRPKQERSPVAAGLVVRSHDLDDVQRRRIEKYARTILAERAIELGVRTRRRRMACFNIGCRIGVYVHHGILPLDDVEHTLAPAWRACGGAQKHGPNEFKRHLRSGIARAANDPLRLPEDRPFRRSQGGS